MHYAGICCCSSASFSLANPPVSTQSMCMEPKHRLLLSRNNPLQGRQYDCCKDACLQPLMPLSSKSQTWTL